MLTDARGLAVTAASAEAVAALDATVAAFCGLRRDTGDHLKRALALDPQFVMAQILKGCFMLLFARRDLHARAVQAAAAAAAVAQAAGATAREAAHLRAIEDWMRGDTHGALARWDAVLRDHPRDLVALKLAHYLAFYHGDSAGMLRSLDHALPAWDGGVPGYGFVLGCRAFALEECGEYGAAEHAGRRAVELDPTDIWAAHAVAHVYEMQDRPTAGLDWIAAVEPHWGAVNTFVLHARWHRCLFLLELGRGAEALEHYDRQGRAEPIQDYLELANAASLLWRLEQSKIDVGARWRELAENAAARADDHMLAFADVHYALALADDDAGVARWLQSSRAFADAGRGTAAAVMAEVGLAVGAASIAHRRRDWSRVVELLLPARQRIRALGGSHAQRDLFEQMLIDAAFEDGRMPVVRALLGERQERRPGNAWGLRQAARAAAALPRP